MATHSITLAWKIPGMGKPGGSHLWGRTESDTAEATQQQQQHISGLIHHLSCCVWLTSVNIKFSRFNHVVACVKISFFFHCMYIPHFVYPCISQQTVRFPPSWIIVNLAAMKVGTQIPAQGHAFTSFGYYLQIFPILWFAFSLS